MTEPTPTVAHHAGKPDETTAAPTPSKPEPATEEVAKDKPAA